MDNLTRIRNAAKEMHDVMQLDESLAPDAMFVEAKKYIREAAEWLQPDDVFSDDTQKIIDRVLDETPDIPFDEFTLLDANGDEITEEPVENVPEEAVTDDQPVNKADNETQIIIDGIDDAETLAELKSIAKYHDVFKGIRNELTKFKTVDALRNVMLQLIKGEAPTEKVEVPVESVSDTKVAEKEKPKKDKTEKTAPAPIQEPENNTDLSAKGETSADEIVVVRGNTFTRIDAICEALKLLKPKTIDEWCIVSNELYHQRGGGDNMKQSRRRVNQVIDVLKNFDIQYPRS